jgi:preprotein translocase subunit SecY
MRRQYSSFAPPRRRRSPWPVILLLLLVALIAGIVYLSSVDTEVPIQRIEQDVTNAALAG